MDWTSIQILKILDDCPDAYTFPMLDNGYKYPAATRLALFRSSEDWALVIEVFGYSPRAGNPDVSIYTFASRLSNRRSTDVFRSDQDHQNYLQHHPHNEMGSVYPFDGEWKDEQEQMCDSVKEVSLRGQRLPVPATEDYAIYDIALEQAPAVHVFEFCRAMAHRNRDLVLATPEEQRLHVQPELAKILQLEEWHHPNVVDEEDRPSGSETFQQLAEVLVSGDTKLYRPTLPPNTHWSNWPDGGTL